MPNNALIVSNSCTSMSSTMSKTKIKPAIVVKVAISSLSAFFKIVFIIAVKIPIAAILNIISTPTDNPHRHKTIKNNPAKIPSLL